MRNGTSLLNTARGGRWAMAAYILMGGMFILIGKGDAISVTVENGTFEVGSIDAHVAFKITPKPDVVQKVTWYHCFSPNTCSEFYVIDNIEELVKQKGELGDRTSHTVMDDGSEYIIYLVILNPKDGDQGEYRCQVQVADEDHLLQGNMRLTKLETLRDATGKNITAGIDATEMSLVIRIYPHNVTLYWIKCFHSNMPEPAEHFYTYNKNKNKIGAEGDIGTRTSHILDNQKHVLLFSLIIQRPGLNDAGPYCCQVDAAGTMEPRLVVMWAEVVVTGTSSLKATEFAANSNLAIRPDEWQPQASHYITAVVFLSFFIILSLSCLVHYCWKRKKRLKRRGLEDSLKTKLHKPFLID